MNPGYLRKIGKLSELSEVEKARLEKVVAKFAFYANEYYLSLIDWSDPTDPIKRLIIPDENELEEWGRLDASDEKSYTVLPGVQHKYNSTAVMLISNACGGICRYCFRKRIFMDKHEEILRDLPAALNYVRRHREINNVLLTGGDPLLQSTPRLENIIGKLREIDHVRIIRIGSKIPAFNPYRILNDPSLLEMIAKYTLKDRKIYLVTHFNNPQELTDAAVSGINLLQKAGAVLANQTPLIRGVNDNPVTLARLLNKLSFIGVRPYYIFQCRPAIGNKPYAVPIEEGYEIFEGAKALVSGLAKRARFVMSHASGKIEIVGKAEDFMYFKYHRAAKDADSGRFMVFKSNPDAYWFDDYKKLVRDSRLSFFPKPLIKDESSPAYSGSNSKKSAQSSFAGEQGEFWP